MSANRTTYRDQKNEKNAVNKKGGATNTSDTVGLYPSVALNVVKYALNDRAMVSEVNRIANHHTFQSVMACQNPFPCPPTS